MSLYGLIIGISIIIGLNYFEKNYTPTKKGGFNYLVYGILLTALLGARAYHVADFWDYYSFHPGEIYKTWHGGLGIFGAFLGSLVYILIYSRFTGESVLTILNAITPILPLCQALGRLGNFVNKENPSWWLEAVLDLCLYLLINIFKSTSPTGLYLIGYGAIRFTTEFFRSDTWQINSFKVGQGVSILLILLGSIIFTHENQKVTGRHRQKRLMDPKAHR